MLQGRIGGDGAPFNFGEATVTRAAVRIASGEVGFCLCAGPRPRQGAPRRAVRRAVAERDDARSASSARCWRRSARGSKRERARRREEIAATRVDFFTLVRGED